MIYDLNFFLIFNNYICIFTFFDNLISLFLLSLCFEIPSFNAFQVYIFMKVLFGTDIIFIVTEH